MNGNKTIWIVLGIGLLALVLFLLFGSNPGQDTANTVNQAETTTKQAASRAAIRTEAATELASLRVRQEAGESYDSLKTRYAEVRTRLATAYVSTEGEAKQEWTEISADFDRFEADARVGTSNSLDALTRLIARLSADVRTETAAE